MAQSPHFLKLSESDRKSVTSAKMLFDKERRVNSDELSRHVGQPIIYGQAVQLRHVNSGMFLTVKKTAAVVERGALRLVLSPGHRGSWFSVASGRSPQVKLMPLSISYRRWVEWVQIHKIKKPRNGP